MKPPIKMTPGDELHLTALMAPFSLNLVTGQDRQHLLGYGRAAFEAGKAGQAAPVAVGEREEFEAWARSYGSWEVKRDDDQALGTTGYTDLTLTVAWHAIQARAALVATPADCQRPECISRGCFGHCQKGRK